MAAGKEDLMDERVVHDRLAANLLFRAIPEAILVEACAIPERVSYAVGDIIFEEGAVADYLYLIVEGTVRISKRGRGGQQETLCHLREGDFFGEMALYDLQARSARASAVQATQLGRIDRRGLERLFHLGSPQFSENVTQRLIGRLRETDLRLIQQVLEAERLSLIGSMAAGIIHDLKNPLSTILLASSILQEREDDRELVKLTGVIRRSIDRMLGMIQEILDYSRGQAELTLCLVPLDRLMGELEEQVLSQLPERGVHLEKAISFRGHLMLDHNRVRRVLENLIKNAAEAMPEGGTLTLSVDAREESIVIGVADTGCGIPDEILPTIFEPFITHGKAGGTGLGLALAKAVVEAHRGTIRVESAVGQGSRFEILLPHSDVAMEDAELGRPDNAA